MKFADIDLIVQMIVECPECDEEIDLARSEFNSEGEYIGEIFTSNVEWRKNLHGQTFECPECNKEFYLGEINW